MYSRKLYKGKKPPPPPQGGSAFAYGQKVCVGKNVDKSTLRKCGGWIIKLLIIYDALYFIWGCDHNECSEEFPCACALSRILHDQELIIKDNCTIDL